MRTIKIGLPSFLPRIAMALTSTLLLAGNAQAALIPAFGLDEFPNFEALELLVAYDSGTEQLFAVGDNVDLFLGEESSIDTVDGSGFRLNVVRPTLEGAGGISGTIEITGFIPDMGFESGVLLTGNVTEFGFVESGDLGALYELQVVFEITGGDAAGLFGPTGAIGLINTDFPGLFTEDWVNDGEGQSVTADFAPVPLPGALWLLGSGVLGLMGFGRRGANRAH